MASSAVTPKRIQRKRTKGWKMPPNTIYVGRPTKWGNPWNLKAFGGDRRKSVRLYRAWLVGTFSERTIEKICGKGIECPSQPLAMLRWLMIRGALRKQVSELRGKNLACWCREGQPCHADVLLEIANSREVPDVQP